MKKILAFFLITPAILIAMWLLFEHGYIRFNYPSHIKYPIRGIDVSHHQGKIDWHKVKNEDIQFVYIKATEGGDFKDPSFNENWNGAKNEGMKVGAYHFFTLCKPVQEQINNFLSTVPLEEDALPPALDLEFMGNCKNLPIQVSIPQDIQIFIDALKNRYGKEPILYVTYEFYEAYLKSAPFAKKNIWVRSVFSTPVEEPKWIIWQFANNARLPGIKNPVDLNVYNSDQLP